MIIAIHLFEIIIMLISCKIIISDVLVFTIFCTKESDKFYWRCDEFSGMFLCVRGLMSKSFLY
jgi:hypothetical protein